MSLRIVLELHQVDDIVINDVNRLNQALMQTAIGDITKDQSFEYDDDYTGFFKIDNNTLLLADHCDGYWEGYENYSHVYSFGNLEAQTIADHLDQGKIVFHKDIEGNPDEYWIITPGNVRMISASELRF